MTAKYSFSSPAVQKAFISLVGIVGATIGYAVQSGFFNHINPWIGPFIGFILPYVTGDILTDGQGGITAVSGTTLIQQLLNSIGQLQKTATLTQAQAQTLAAAQVALIELQTQQTTGTVTPTPNPVGTTPPA